MYILYCILQSICIHFTVSIYHSILNTEYRFIVCILFTVLPRAMYINKHSAQYTASYTVWCNQMGTVGKLTIFDWLKLLTWLYYLNSENFYLFVFVSSKSYNLIRTCLIVWFISCMLIKSVRFRTVPIWLHHSVYNFCLYLTIRINIE